MSVDALAHGAAPLPDYATLVLRSPLEPFPCPISPATGLIIRRQLTIQLACDPEGAPNKSV